MQFKDIVLERYATKKFDGKKIPDEKIDDLVELIRFAPSALNLQPWRIRIITDQNIKELLKPAAFNQEQITTCSHLLVFCADPDYSGLIKKLEKLLKDNNIPEEVQTMIVGMASQSAGAMTREQQLAWSQAQTYLALGNAVNGAKSLGFDSCPMGGFNPAEFSRILNIPAPLVPVMLCPVGYAADKAMPKVRFSKEEILF
ncbi:nitroreductase family protein [Methanosphaerula palustris]|uniref:Nitroreductase n=1 Tax=Methanosphaerula palustris (strain ATCC BAA-1556 / DSM 19958 / E1-9c) TaxID=521011 RepID=B8GJE8_METPE|nr:NAD(P)H-dependent oxidoreductase [Methanosphaerula palustris]ACL16989.1 nitroreductase [Methanosphaerula palustris E1-9c]